jgi:hypothetical protein
VATPAAAGLDEDGLGRREEAVDGEVPAVGERAEEGGDVGDGGEVARGEEGKVAGTGADGRGDVGKVVAVGGGATAELMFCFLKAEITLLGAVSTLNVATVLRIRIRIRIRMVLGLLDPDLDPLVRGSYPDPNPSIIKQK